MKLVSPIRNESDIGKIKKFLSGNKRDLFFFVLGINTGIRAGDLLKLRIKDLKYTALGGQIPIIEEKTGKRNYIIINKTVYKAFQDYLQEYNPGDNDFILFSRKGDRQENHLHIFSMSRIVKQWFEDLNMPGSWGCHSMRKTWGYQQRVKYGVDWSIICRRYNHSNPSVTMRYLGITADEVSQICMNEI